MNEQLYKYRELFIMSKEAYVQEVERIRRLEDKSAKFGSFCGLLLTILGFAGGRLIIPFVPPNNIFGWICLSSYFFFMIFMAYAFFNLIRVLRISNIHTNPMNQETIAFFDKNSHIDILYALARNYIKAIELNNKEYSKKLKNLKKSYSAMNISMTLILIFILSFFVSKFLC